MKRERDWDRYFAAVKPCDVCGAPSARTGNCRRCEGHRLTPHCSRCGDVDPDHFGQRKNRCLACVKVATELYVRGEQDDTETWHIPHAPYRRPTAEYRARQLRGQPCPCE